MKGRRAVAVSAVAGAVLFDVDGTLADTDPLHAQAWRITTEQHFDLTFSWEMYRQACLEEGISPADFLRSLGAPLISDEIAREKGELYKELVRAGLTLAPGVVELLAIIDAARIPIAIVSSGSRRSVDTLLGSLWPASRPPVTISRDDTQRHKPHPDPYVKALAELGRKAIDCVAIEDTSRGFCSANSAGLQTIVVHRNWNNDTRPAPDLVVRGLDDLMAYVDEGFLFIQESPRDTG